MTRLNISQVFGRDFAKRHAMMFKIMKANNLALCGSTACALVKGDTSYFPTDLDFVGANDGSVESAVAELSSFLSTKPNHWVIQCNSLNGYCHGFARMHARITCKLWLPICIFGIDADMFKSHMWKGNVNIQDLNSIRQNAAEFTNKDGKYRYANFDKPCAGANPQPATTAAEKDIEAAKKWHMAWEKFQDDLIELKAQEEMDALLDPPYKPKTKGAPF